MQSTTNTFTEGLVMDFAPEISKKESLTNALNATILTFNGNEYQLQNDMGNAHIPNAELPAGYMPLGTAELGGIMYIVAYNPFTNKCQIGSFPSPQRITSTEDEDSQELTKISAFDTQKIIVSDKTFNPGDKFYFTIDNEILLAYQYDGNVNTYKSNENADAIEVKDYEKFIRIQVGVLTDENKLLYLNDNNEFIHYQNPNTEESNTENSKYWIVFNSKISGKLVIILNKIIPNYTASLQAFINKKGIPEIIINNNFSSEYKFAPKAINYGISYSIQSSSAIGGITAEALKSSDGSVKITNENDEIKCEYTWNYKYNLNNVINDSNFFNAYLKQWEKPDIFVTLTPIYYNKNITNVIIDSAAYTPQTITKVINYNNLLEGNINLSSYTYVFSNENLIINYTIDAMMSEEESIIPVGYTIYQVNENNQIIELLNNKLENLNGAITIPFSDNGLKQNELYVIKFTIKVTSIKSEVAEDGITIINTKNTENKDFYQWLWTNDLCYNENSNLNEGIITKNISLNIKNNRYERSGNVDKKIDKIMWGKTQEQLLNRTIKSTSTIHGNILYEIEPTDQDNINMNISYNLTIGDKTYSTNGFTCEEPFDIIKVKKFKPTGISVPKQSVNIISPINIVRAKGTSMEAIKDYDGNNSIIPDPFGQNTLSVFRENWKFGTDTVKTIDADNDKYLQQKWKNEYNMAYYSTVNFSIDSETYSNDTTHTYMALPVGGFVGLLDIDPENNTDQEKIRKLGLRILSSLYTYKSKVFFNNLYQVTDVTSEAVNQDSYLITLSNIKFTGIFTLSSGKNISDVITIFKNNYPLSDLNPIIINDTTETSFTVTVDYNESDFESPVLNNYDSDDILLVSPDGNWAYKYATIKQSKNIDTENINLYKLINVNDWSNSDIINAENHTIELFKSDPDDIDLILKADQFKVQLTSDQESYDTVRLYIGSMGYHYFTIDNIKYQYNANKLQYVDKS